jgi:23S rRNA (cytidine1920-2'-O)/16S rRNA (cytidine1409-2'-O)-methyltransferase
MRARRAPRRNAGRSGYRSRPMAKQRLDTLLAERGLFDSRSRAAASVMAGEVRVGSGGQRAQKPGEMVALDALLQVDERPRYVSRGGTKLENALRRTGLPVAGRRALDVGASTGGFTDCLLQHGAAEVVAVDVGYGELHYRLRTDARVRVLERTNARSLTSAMVAAARSARSSSGRGGTEERCGARTEERRSEPAGAGGIESPQDAAAGPPDLAVVDVSFISLAKVLPAVVGCLAETYDALALVKPQFEAPRGAIGKGGVVRDPATRRAALVAVGLAAARIASAPTQLAGAIERPSATPAPSGPPAVLGFCSSGLPGPKGNRETFIWLAEPGRAGGAQSAEEIERMALLEEP